MQGTYSGPPKDLRSPLYAFNHYNAWNVTYEMGTDIDSNDTSGFPAAVAAAEAADIVIYLGGIDTSIEAETMDRTTITWPGNQLDLITRLSDVAKQMLVVQFGGGQLDDSAILEDENISALVWAGLPSQAGGRAVLNVLTGRHSIAGRLPITQYPASYTDEVSIFTIGLRPNDTFPGRTYKWYTGEAVRSFGYGLHYTTFDFEWTAQLNPSYTISDLVDSCKSHDDGPINDNTPFTSVSATVSNTGNHTSDYSGLLFLSSANAGPAPRPIKSLVSYQRLHEIPAKGKAQLDLPLTLGSLARADEDGSTTIYPGDYKLTLDVDSQLTFEFSLEGDAVVIDTLPKPKDEYEFTVPVHVQPPSFEDHGS